MRFLWACSLDAYQWERRGGGPDRLRVVLKRFGRGLLDSIVWFASWPARAARGFSMRRDVARMQASMRLPVVTLRKQNWKQDAEHSRRYRAWRQVNEHTLEQA